MIDGVFVGTCGVKQWYVVQDHAPKYVSQLTVFRRHADVSRRLVVTS